MKDLNNHIFSNTTCISKETMLKYINKQLSKEELHQTEKHMLDCELCTDAYEGMAYAENASMLFAIDNQIDKRVRIGRAKTPIIRNLMVTASILVIVFGTYFTFNFFNETVNGNNLAINEVEEETKMFHEEAEVDVRPYQQIEVESIVQNNIEDVDLKERLNEEVAKEFTKVPEVVVLEQKMIEEQEIILDDAEIVTAADAFFVAEDVELEEEITVEVDSKEIEVLEESLIAMKFVTNETPTVEKDVAMKSKIANTSSLKKGKGNRTTKDVASAPIITEIAVNSKNEDRNNVDQKLLIIEGYKLVNYLNEYQEAYDAESRILPEVKSVSAGFESEADKNIAEKARKKTTVEITYKETLEAGIHLYKKGKYKQALGAFDIILRKHPEDVNAQFYSGLCYYHLVQHPAAIKKFNTVLKNNETAFNEETNWYKALTLINMKEIVSAKKLLNNIIEKDGFYKTNAENKLKEL